jgi:dipeptidyl aminopeptidase/acylaminoacyl peptidase
MQKLAKRLFVLSLCWLVQFVAFAQEQRPLTVTDIMQFREIKDVKLSDNGQWMAYIEQPDRGDSSGHIKSTDGKKVIDIPLAKKPVLSKNGQWVAFLTTVSLLERETATKEQKKEFKDGAVIVNTSSGQMTKFENVKAVNFTGDSNFALIHYNKHDDTKDEKDKKKNNKGEPEKDKTEVKHFLKKDHIGSPAELVTLATGDTKTLDNVQKAAFANEGSYFAYTEIVEEGVGNKLVVLNTQNQNSVVLDSTTLASYPHLKWSDDGRSLAFLKGSYADKEPSRQHTLMLYTTSHANASIMDTEQEGWFISHDNTLTWSDDNARLFFGKKPVAEVVKTDDEIKTQDDLFDVSKLTSGKELQVWHGDDPRIKPHAAKEYKDEQSHTWLNVLSVRSKKSIALIDQSISSASATDNTKALLATDDQPYRKLITWDGFYADLFHIDLKTSQKTQVQAKLSQGNADGAKLSESGRYVTYYHEGSVWTFDSKRKTTTNLTKELSVPFANELHDYPSSAPGYGIAGWLENDAGVLVYDRYDIWLFTKAGKATNLTHGDGRKRQVIYRITQTNDEQEYFNTKQNLLLNAYYDRKKNFGFYELSLDDGKLFKLLEADKRYRFVKKAQDTDIILFTQEDMHEFPDIWSTNTRFNNPKKLTHTNPQIDEFLWGSSELVEWRSTTGKELQGVLIKPANYEAGKRYPVLVYYYRYFSQRLHEFNAMKVNHRPNFPFYHSNGYAVFLPDIKFDIGLPGPSATQALVPGIQKIIDMGVADPDAIGLHGHSWSGYQSAFAITQTNVFKAAVAGAPVANMTSAYSGIRLGSGLSRAFQYESGQSRIGGDLVDDLNLYIENSPVFFADRINTPLLIQFGDVDDAVPWQQGIEMYTVMRRLNKPVIMLQYEGEPHHLKKYPNKVDYTIKMKQFFDHHLKGTKAPKWMVEGVPYSEKPMNNPE